MPLGSETTTTPSDRSGTGTWKAALGLVVAAVVLVGTPALLLRLGGSKVQAPRPVSDPVPVVALATGDEAVTVLTYRTGCDRDCDGGRAVGAVDGTWRIRNARGTFALDAGGQAALTALLTTVVDGPDDLDYSTGPNPDGTPRPPKAIGGTSDRLTLVLRAEDGTTTERVVSAKDPGRNELWDSAYDRDRRAALLSLRNLLGAARP